MCKLHKVGSAHTTKNSVTDAGTLYSTMFAGPWGSVLLKAVFFFVGVHRATNAVTVLDPNGWYILPKPADLNSYVSALYGIPFPNTVKPFSKGVEEIDTDLQALEAASRRVAAAAIAKQRNAYPTEDELQLVVAQQKQAEQQRVQEELASSSSVSLNGELVSAPQNEPLEEGVESQVNAAAEKAEQEESIVAAGGGGGGAAHWLRGPWAASAKPGAYGEVPPSGVGPVGNLAPAGSRRTEAQILEDEEKTLDSVGQREHPSATLVAYQGVCFFVFMILGGIFSIIGLWKRSWYLMFATAFFVFVAMLTVAVSVLRLGGISTICLTLLLSLGATVISTSTFGQFGLAPSEKFVTVPLGWFLSVVGDGLVVANVVYSSTVWIITVAGGKSWLLRIYATHAVISGTFYCIVIGILASVVVHLFTTLPVDSHYAFATVIGLYASFVSISGCAYLLNVGVYGGASQMEIPKLSHLPEATGIPLSPLLFFHPLCGMSIDGRYWGLLMLLIVATSISSIYQGRAAVAMTSSEDISELKSVTSSPLSTYRDSADAAGDWSTFRERGRRESEEEDEISRKESAFTETFLPRLSREEEDSKYWDDGRSSSSAERLHARRH